MLVFCSDVVDGLDAEDAASSIWQEVESKVDAIEFAARNLHIARHAGANSHNHSIVTIAQLIPRDVLADFHAGAEAGAFGFHLLDTAVNQTLFELKVRNAVTHQATESIILFVDNHGVAGAGQLLCHSKTRRAGADYGHGLIGQALRR